MKTLRSLLTASLIAGSLILPNKLNGQEGLLDITKPNIPVQNVVQKKTGTSFSRIGMTFRNFNDNDANNEVGYLAGFELSYGKYLSELIRGEVYTSWLFKNWDNGNKSININEIGFFAEIAPGDFFFGLAPKLAIYSGKNGNDESSETALGFGGRIGYEFKLSEKCDLEFDVNYSKLNMEEDGKTYDIGTNGFSVRVKF